MRFHATGDRGVNFVQFTGGLDLGGVNEKSFKDFGVGQRQAGFDMDDRQAHQRLEARRIASYAHL